MLHAGLMRRRHCMAILTRKNLGVTRSDVAIAAHGPLVRKPELGVVEDGAQPCRGRVRRVAGVATIRVVA